MIARLALSFCLTLFACLVMNAQEAKESAEQARAPVFDIGEIDVPDGNVADMIEFLDEMGQLQKKIASDYRAAISKISAAQAKASNQILDNSDEVSDEDFASSCPTRS